VTVGVSVGPSPVASGARRAIACMLKINEHVDLGLRLYRHRGSGCGGRAVLWTKCRICVRTGKEPGWIERDRNKFEI